MEDWKNIENIYGFEVSSMGRIKNIETGKIRILSKNSRGYMGLIIKGHYYNIHRLVANAFIPNPFNKSQVNHIDGDKTNNKLENLEWVTHSENMKHAFDNGLVKTSTNQNGRNLNAKLSDEDVLNIYKSKLETLKLSKKYNVSKSTIRFIRAGKTWTHITQRPSANLGLVL